MKKNVLFGLFAIAVAATLAAAPDPAVVYCESLGYECEVVSTASGQRTIVKPAQGVAFDAWDFFRGKVGAEYSYGAIVGGYETICVSEKVGDYTVEYGMCVPTAAGRALGLKPVRTDELMLGKGHWLGAPGRAAKRFADREADASDDGLLAIPKVLPSTFDWRNAGGLSYIGPVRDQGNCGSCYSFAACAAAEGTYNYAMGLYGAACSDFSESFVIWCLGRLSQYNSHFYGCDGADYDYYELAALTAYGVCAESAFPYTENDPGTCAHWDKPRTVFDSWHRAPCGDIDAIKTALMTFGVIDAAVLTTSGFNNYNSGVYDDSNTSCSASPCYYAQSDHAISLVGWDDNPPEGGGGCWILRNSWGTSWGENGYMRIRYNAAAVACAATYLRCTVNTNVADHIAMNDYTGDGKSELTAYNQVNGQWFITDAAGQTNFLFGECGGAGFTPVPGDYNGDGISDLAVYHEASGTWYARDVSGQWLFFGLSWGAPGLTPVAGDYNGDGVSDLALYHEATGTWYAREVSGQWGLFGVLWGGPGMAPVSGDYNGDGINDLAVYWGSKGKWHITDPSGQWTRQDISWGGVPGMRAVPGDYNGDGRSDLALYFENTGTWYVRDVAGQWNLFGVPWGGPGLVPAPGDYNGDKTWDFAVYGPATGYWYITSPDSQWMRFGALWGGPGLIPAGCVE